MKSTLKLTTVLAVLAACLFSSSSLLAQDASSKSLVQAYVEVWNSGSAAGLDAILAENFTRTAPASVPNSSVSSLAAMKETIARTFEQNSSVKVGIKQAVYGENEAAILWTFKSEVANMSGMSMFKIADGKIVSIYVTWDTMTQMQQMGFTVTPPAQAGE